MEENKKLAMIWIKEDDSKTFDKKLADLSNKKIVGKPDFWVEDGIFNFRAYVEGEN